MKIFVVGALALMGVPCVNAQLETGFEAPDYAVGGLEGQNGWYIPVAGSIDFQVYEYGGDPHGFSSNPTGGKQFIVGQWNGDNSRAQLDHDFSAGGVWTIAYDVNNIYDGAQNAVNNIGSFSLQPSTTNQSYIDLNLFGDVNVPTTWNANVNYYDAAGVALSAAPGAEWTSLEFNKWYRRSATFDFDTHQILEVSITDLESGITTTVNPDSWYLNGGADSMLPLPTAFRFFASGNTSNVTGWDNLTVIPAPGAVTLLGLGLLGVARRRR
jgi:hypothetical protein